MSTLDTTDLDHQSTLNNCSALDDRSNQTCGLLPCNVAEKGWVEKSEIPMVRYSFPVSTTDYQTMDYNLHIDFGFKVIQLLEKLK